MATEIKGLKISQIPEVTKLTGNEMIPCEYSGTNGKFDAVTLANYVTELNPYDPEGKVKQLREDVDNLESEVSQITNNISDLNNHVTENTENITKLKNMPKSVLFYDNTAQFPSVGSSESLYVDTLTTEVYWYDHEDRYIKINKQVYQASSKDAFPPIGNQLTIYVSKSENKLYRWDGGKYVELSQQATTNNPDNEDLIAEENVLKFANKNYSTDTFSGLGRIYLRKNITSSDSKNVLTQTMVDDANTRYIIQYDYDLNGETITIQEGCVLDFQGGSISNGTIVGTNTKIFAGLQTIFNSVTFAGKFNVTEAYPEWFGAIPNGEFDCSFSIQSALHFLYNSLSTNSTRYSKKTNPILSFSNGDYAVNTTILTVGSITLRGNGTNIISSMSSENPVFDTAYVHTDGTWHSTTDLSDSELIPNKAIIGLRFENLNFDSVHFCIRNTGAVWSSWIKWCNFYDCGIVCKGSNNFYFSYSDIEVYGTKSSEYNTTGKFIFGKNANRILFQNVNFSSIGSPVGNTGYCIQFLEGFHQVSIENCAFEICDIGIQLTGSGSAFNFRNIYAETVNSVIIDTDGAIKKGVYIDAVYSYQITNLIKASGLRNSVIKTNTDGQNPLYRGVVNLYAGTNSNRAVIYTDDGVDELLNTKYQCSGNIRYAGPFGYLKNYDLIRKTNNPDIKGSTKDGTVSYTKRIYNSYIIGKQKFFYMEINFTVSDGSGFLTIANTDNTAVQYAPMCINILKHDGIAVNSDEDLYVDFNYEYQVMYLKKMKKDGTGSSYVDLPKSAHIILSGMYTPIIKSYPES